MVRNNLLLRLIKKHPTFTFVLLALFLLAIIIGPAIFIINQRFGTGMFYGFFTSHNLDYYHYVSIIRQGIEEGGLLFRNQFSDPWRAKVLYMPIYSFFGLVARVIAIDQFQMYFFTRIISVAVFIALIALFIQNTYQKKSLQIIALLFSFLATSYYNIACLVGCEPIFPVTYSDLHFNAFYRLLVLPPHHYLAVVFLILNVFFIVRFRMKVWWLVIYLLSCVLLVLLHPYIGFVWAFMYGFYVVLSLVLDRKVSRSNWFLLCLTGGVIMLFELITQRSYGVMVNSFVLSFNPAYVSAVPLRKFVEGMGYIMVPFLLSVLLVNKWRHNHFLRFCLTG